MKPMDVKSEHDFFLTQLKRHARDTGRFNLARYLGTDHIMYNVSVPKRREIVASWARSHKDVSKDNLVSLVDLLFSGESHEEKSQASMLLGCYERYLVALEERRIDQWLEKLEGWAEVDSFCDEIDVWFRDDVAHRISMLTRWNKHAQIEKRRASLVVLCSSVRHDDRKMFADLSFGFIDARKAEKHVMITKAISWLLRALVKYHKADVAKYLKKNIATLPKIAVREVTGKLETGRKSGKSKRVL